MNLLNTNELPKDFKYPNRFLRTVERGLLYLEPWFVLEGELLRNRYHGLKSRYPDRILIPFARREDNDNVACWEFPDTEKVHIVHDFASPGFEEVEVLGGFYLWLRKALEDMIEFDSFED